MKHDRLLLGDPKLPRSALRHVGSDASKEIAAAEKRGRRRAQYGDGGGGGAGALNMRDLSSAQRMFEQFDANDDGTISVPELKTVRAPRLLSHLFAVRAT